MDDERDPVKPRSSSIAPRGGAIWAERALLALIMGTLAATCNLLVAVHRHTATTTGPPDLQVTGAVEPPVRPLSASVNQPTSPVESAANKGAAVQSPTAAVESFPPPEDPTKKAIGALTSATAGEVEATQKADRRAAAFESARLASEAESRRWKRREMLVRQQIAGLAARADQLESTASSLDAERDVLAKERDALKAALSKASQRSGFAVLPYKGPNGTWRRPIVLECASGGVKLQPKGLTFTALDLSPLINPRSSPLVRSIAHEMLHIQTSDTPDGAAAVPYLVFLVRPAGIRHYYEARSCLEPLGIAFGYELIEQDLAVDIPDFDNLATWDGSVPLDLPIEPAPRPKFQIAMISPTEPANGTAFGSRGDRPASTAWPAGSGRGGQQRAGDADNSTPEDFVWPKRGRPNAANDRKRAASVGLGGNSGQGDADGAAHDTDGAGADRHGSSASDGSSEPFGGQAGQSAGEVDGGGTPGSTGSGVDLRGASRSTLSPNGSMGPSVSAGGGMGPSASAGGGMGSSVSAGGGMGPIVSAGGGMGPSVSAGGGTGSNNGSVGIAGTSPAPAGVRGSAAGLGGRTGSSLTKGSPRAGTLSATGDRPSVSGPGVDPAANGGTNALPDLEPAGDGGSFPPLPPPALVRPGGPSGAASGAGGQNQNNSGSTSAGQNPLAQPDAGLPAASLGGGTAANNPGSTSAGGDLSAQPYLGQPAGSLGDSPVSDHPSGSVVAPPSTGAASRPASPLNPPGGLAAPSSTSSPSAFGMPSSSSSSTSSSGSMAGMPTDSSSSPSSSKSSSSTLSLGQAGSSDPSSDDLIFPPAPKPVASQGSIEVPFEIVVVCRRDDVLLHPGGYRLTARAIQRQLPSKDGVLAREIVAMVRKRAIVDPLIRPKPKIKFLVETDGADTFWAARRQLLFALSDWPMSLQVSGPQASRVLTKETW